MNYCKIYEDLIKRGKSRELIGYKEKHHIIPRCMGGPDEKDNLVELTAEEHYVAHQLLVKIYPKNRLLVRAAAMMIPGRKSNKLYGWLRRRFSEVQSFGQTGQGNSQYGSFWITNGIEEKKIKFEIPHNWEKGRLVGFKTRQKRAEIAKLRDDGKNNTIFIKKNEFLQSLPVIEQIKELEKLKNEKLEELRAWHEIYKVDGFAGVVNAGYKFSKPNLVVLFSKHLPEFIPQNGKKRIK